MKVSIIMGIYNCATTLQEALDSLYAQTFQDFEIILCDDGSTDNTFDIAEQNLLEHPGKIVLIQNEYNCGLNITLNRCLECAKGEYIARMDGDDISLPIRLEKEVNFLDTHPEYAIVSTPMIRFDSNGEFYRGKGGNAPTKDSFIKGTPHCHAPCMVRREAYIEVGGYTVNKWLLRHEDYNLWMKMYAKGYRGYNLDECLYAMRDDRDAAVRRNLRGRLNGIYSRYLAYREFHFPFFEFLRYSLLAIVKGIMPKSMYLFFYRRNFSKK